MFTPVPYQATDVTRLRAVIDENPLAIFGTNGPRRPILTHLPAIVPAGTPAGHIGDRVLCHLNRANPHWSALEDGQSAVLTFDGPSGYVSPSCYPAGPAAPTWDFVSVEVSGLIRRITSEAATLAVVRATAEALEDRFGSGWAASGSIDYFRQILPAVGAFEFLVESVGSMFKLSQDKDPQTREQVIRRFEHGERRSGQDLAATMRAYGCGIATDSTRGGL